MIARAWPAVAALVAVAAVLELLALAKVIPPVAIPAPSRILGTYPQLASDHLLLEPALVTFGETLAATAMALVVGIPAGILLSRLPLYGAAYEPWIGGLFSAPLVLFYPVFLVIFHRTNFTVVAMSFVTAVLPVIIFTRTGMLHVPRVLRAVGRSFNLTPRQQFRLIELPAAIPSILTGTRLAIIYAMVSTIGVEFLIDFGGLGRIISDLYAQYDIPQMYAEIIVVVVTISVVLLWALDRLERRLRPA